MGLPFDWDFLQDNLPQEKLAELRRRFIEEWHSGEYTRKEMIERYRMSERAFWEEKKGKPNGFQRPPDPGKCFCIDTGTCFIGDKTQIHFFDKNGISWIKVSKPWDNPFAERGIRTIKHEYLNQVWMVITVNARNFVKSLNWITTNVALINLLIIKPQRMG